MIQEVVYDNVRNKYFSLEGESFLNGLKRRNHLPNHEKEIQDEKLRSRNGRERNFA
jgi:hypothetical protein